MLCKWGKELQNNSFVISTQISYFGFEDTDIIFLIFLILFLLIKACLIFLIISNNVLLISNVHKSE